jgi:hypothetical protein
MGLQQKKKIYILCALWAVFIVIFIVIFQDVLSGEQARVRKFILNGKRCLEAKDIFSCAGMVSKNYHDKYGNDRDSLIYAAKEACAYYKDILIQIESMEIVLNNSKTEAEVEITALAVCKTQNNTPEKILQGDKGRFKVRLAKENKRWKLVELEFYEPITIMGQNIS